MRLFLDTQYAYALGAAWGDLRPHERRFFETTSAALVISTVSIWEMRSDPFDEVLLAQAQEEGLWLLTRDAALAAHPLARTVAALGG